MTFKNQKGTVLTFVVIGVGLIAALSAGALYLTSTASLSGLSASDQNQAYQLAKAGIEYALTNNLATAKTYTLNEGKFRLTFSGDNIESTGIVKEGTPYETKRKIVVKQTGFGSRPDISFTKDIADFSTTIPQLQSKEGLVTVNALGQIEMGQGETKAFGGISYGGSSVQGNCINGICEFRGGFRAYFRFKVVKSPSATLDPHGFVFTFFNGSNNSSTAIGGDLGGSSLNDMPELLGYAGNSCLERDYWSGNCTSYLDGSGNGIRSPKFAIEFDSNQHTCGSGPCHYSSRCDGSRNHMAYVLWGDLSTCSNRENSPTYDDNRHGSGTAGSITIPQNAVANDSSDTIDYFTGLSTSWGEAWLFSSSPTYAMRIEVSRTVEEGKYFYGIRTWIKKCSGCDISDSNCCTAFPDFDNVKIIYNDDDFHPTDHPNLNRKIELDESNHNLFEKFVLGWRFASGTGSPENVTLSSFGLYFVK